ncbi:zinc finger CCCH domain-containing protein 48-like [Euphorbia lathyris]|uniref:zinc finger CCCH domain-containing protein 48-like n=1 Tax=Euphorbia lathyris TaxID=212925 RepID=UPI003313B1C3
MDTKIANFHGRFGGPVKGKVYSNVVCQFWLAGNCKRNPCRFLHSELPTSKRQLPTSKRELPTSKRELPASNVYRRTPKQSKTSNYAPKSSLASPKERTSPNNISASNDYENTSMESLMSCTEAVVNAECPKSSGVISPATEPSTKDLFSMLAQLKGHIKAISGIALPSGSDKLYSASDDGIVSIWDCHTGQSTRIVTLGQKIGCLLSEGSWIFVGLHNSIKAWNFDTKTEYTLGEGNESFGLVNAMITSDDMLFSGGQDGSILAWKGYNEKLKPFKLAASLKGHTAAITCLTVGRNRLYSGSTDGTIRVWDLDTLKSLHLLKTEHMHTDVVRSLIVWEEYLLSCSLDKKIKVWGCTEEGTIEVVYTHDVKHGAIALCGIHDAEKNPVLLCSCNDGCIRQYDLPSFQERGRIYSKDEVRRMEIGPDGLFFTGDALGNLSVWKLAA